MLDPEEHEFHADWDAATAEFVGSFRKSIGEDTDDVRIVELVGTTIVNHPVVGKLHLHRDKLTVGDLTLVLYYPDIGSDSAEKLRVLASLATTTANDEASHDQLPAHKSGSLPSRRD